MYLYWNQDLLNSTTKVHTTSADTFKIYEILLFANFPLLWLVAGQQWQTVGLSICTLISGNQGLEKSNLDFLQVWHPAFLQGGDLERKSRFSEPESFLGLEVDIDFSRPWFSEIRVQIKRPTVCHCWPATNHNNGKLAKSRISYILNVVAGVVWTLVVEFNRSWFQSP